jgi:hyperosmotically inducible protein
MLLKQRGLTMTKRHKKGYSILAILVLFLSLVACHATPTRESTGEYIDDSTTTAKVKTALLSNKLGSIGVETFKGTVQLSGFVSTTDQVIRAGEVARKVEGVKAVHNNLIIKAQ